MEPQHTYRAEDLLTGERVAEGKDCDAVLDAAKTYSEDTGREFIFSFLPDPRFSYCWSPLSYGEPPIVMSNE